MLTRLAIKNFRLLRDVSIDIEPGKPIVLIGPNSSGNSSVLEVLDLLSRWVAADDEDSAFLPLGGVLSVVGPYDSNTVRIEVNLSAVSAQRPSARYGVEFDGTLGLIVGREWLFCTRRHEKADKEIEYLSRNLDDGWILNEKTNDRDQLSDFNEDSLLFNGPPSPQTQVNRQGAKTPSS